MRYQLSIVPCLCITAALASMILFADAPASAQGPAKEGIAVIQPASGSNCRGIVRFRQEGAAVKMVADLEGLVPGAKHGYHIHEFGDCSAPDAASAGSHYDASATKHHGRPDEAVKHSGDMGNLEADGNGKAHLELTLDAVTIDGPNAPILGRAVIIHAKPDDFSQPVGNAGPRIGCGVIGIMKPSAPSSTK